MIHGDDCVMINVTYRSNAPGMTPDKGALELQSTLFRLTTGTNLSNITIGFERYGMV